MTNRQAKTDHPVHDLITERWSPYGFDDRAVPNEDLRSLFEAARWTASSYNEQPWRYLVARREDGEAYARMLAVLVEANQAWAMAAPVLAIGVAVRDFKRNGKPNKAAIHDLGAASAQLTLEATARGLAVHQMIGIDPEPAREAYGIPGNAEAVTALAIGYARSAEPAHERDQAPRERMPLSEILFGGAWGVAAELA